MVGQKGDKKNEKNIIDIRIINSSYFCVYHWLCGEDGKRRGSDAAASTAASCGGAPCATLRDQCLGLRPLGLEWT
jgi:hypothetical protein